MRRIAVFLDFRAVQRRILGRPDYSTAVGPGRSRRAPLIGYREAMEGVWRRCSSGRLLQTALRYLNTAVGEADGFSTRRVSSVSDS